jgi:NAD(P)-dependent dehydrogenase (short-subunit alcohol dehydrogenase family)
MGPYSASKFALEALSEALAHELRAFGVWVTIVDPGIIDTRMARNIEQPGGLKGVSTSSTVRGLVPGDDGGRSGSAAGGQKARKIVESGTWQLRHPVGPNAQPSWPGPGR